MDEKQLQALYNAMQSKLGLGSFDQFKSTIYSDSNFRKAFYNEASSELELGDYSTFDNSLKKKVSQNWVSKIFSPTQSSSTPQSASINGKSDGLSPETIASGKKVSQKEFDEIQSRSNKPDVDLIGVGGDEDFKKDPIKSVNKLLVNKAILNSFNPKAKTESTGQQYRSAINKPQKDEDINDFNIEPIIKQVRENAFGSTQEARDWVYSESKKGTLDENNETDKLAADVIKEHETVKGIIDSNGGDLTKSALQYYGSKDPQIAAMIQEGIEPPKETQSRLLYNFLQDKNVKELAGENQEFHNLYREQLDNFKQNNPEQWVNMLVQKITQGREDYGENNPFLNFVGVNSSDRVIENLLANNEIDQFDYDFYHKSVRPLLKAHAKQVPTTGLLETAFQSAAKSFEDLPESVAEITGAKNLYTTPGERAFEIMQEDEGMASVKPKGLVSKISHATGNLGGVLVPIGLEAKLLKATGLIKNARLAHEIAMGQVFFHDLYTQAERDNPKGGLLNQLQATLQSVVFAKINPMFGQMSKAVVRDATPEIRNILKSLEKETITGAAAKEQITKTIVEKLAEKGSKVAGSSLTAATQMTAAGLINDAIGGVFSGKYDLDQTIQNAVHTFESMVLGTPLINWIATPGRKPVVSDILWEMSNSKEISDHFRNKISNAAKEDADFAKQAPQLLKNLDHLIAVRNELNERTDLTDKQKKKFILAEMSQRVLEDKIASSPSKILTTNDAKKVEALEIEKQMIVDPEMGNQKFVEEMYNADLLPKGVMESLEVEGKFSPAKVGGVLKEIAQQANNLDADWNLHTGKFKMTKPNVPDQLIEAANERWAKEIEAAQPQDKATATTPKGNTSNEGGDVERIDAIHNKIKNGENITSEDVVGLTSQDKNKNGIPSFSDKGAFEYHNDINDYKGKIIDIGGQPTVVTMDGKYKPINWVDYNVKTGKYEEIQKPDRVIKYGDTVPKSGEIKVLHGSPSGKIEKFDENYFGKGWQKGEFPHERFEGIYADENTDAVQNISKKTGGGYGEVHEYSMSFDNSISESKAEKLLNEHERGADKRLSRKEASKYIKSLGYDMIYRSNGDGTYTYVGLDVNKVKPAEQSPSKQESGGEQKTKTDETPKETTNVNEPVKAEEKPQPEKTVVEDSEGAGKEPPTEKPPIEGKGEGEGEGSSGITHAANEVRRKDRNLPEYQKEPQSFEQWNNEAEKAIKEGYDVEKLMDEIEAGKDPNPVENAIRKIYVATLDAEIAKNPTDELLAKQKRFIEIGDLANSRAGRNLASLKGEGSPLESISDFYVAKMEAAGVDRLTEQQKKETKDAFDKVQKADENATAAMEAYREEIAKLKAENEILRQKKESKKPSKPQTKEDFIAQRKSLRDKLKQQVEEFKAEGQKMGIASDGGLKSTIITAKMAKTIGEIAKSYIDEVGVNLKEVIKKTFEEVKDLITGITEKDIHNVLAGEYTEPKPTRNELAAKMRDLKDEAYYINKLDRLSRGEEPKKERDKVKRNQQITELQKKIKDLQKELPPTDAELKKRLESIKTKNENETAKIKERIAKGDFETKKRVPFLEDPEMQKRFPTQYKAALDAITKREDARHEFDIALLKDQMAKRGFAKKYVVDLTGDIIGTTRALVTGIDASGIGIQNIVALVAHPRSAIKAFPASFGDFFSSKNQERWLASVHSSELFPLAQKFQLDITEPQSLKASEKEEIFTHNLLDRRIRYKYKGKEKTFVISKYTTKPFERIFVGLGNRMRWNLWQRGVEKLYEEGFTPQKHPEEFESLAKVLNTETGRGTLHPTIKKGYNFWSSIIWSPRLMASRMNILGIGDLGNLVLGGKKGYYGGLTPRMREYALKDLAKFVIFGSTMLALAGLTFADDTDTDPNSGTFGTFEADGKRYNIWGGFTQYVRLMAALGMGGEKRGGEFKESNQLKTALRFLWGKTTPVASTAISLANKDRKDYMGVPVTAESALESLTVPLSIRGIIKGIKKEGAGSILWTGVPSFVGLNVSYQSDFDKQSQGTTITIKNPLTQTERKLSQDEQKAYEDRKTVIHDELLADIKENGVGIDSYGNISLDVDAIVGRKEFKDLDEEEQKSILTRISLSAAGKSKSEVQRREMKIPEDAIKALYEANRLKLKERIKAFSPKK